jgi:hypothetical protein
MVARVAARDHGGLHYRRRRGEVGLAGTETNDIEALGLELLGLRVDGQSGRRRDIADPE